MSLTYITLPAIECETYFTLPATEGVTYFTLSAIEGFTYVTLPAIEGVTNFVGKGFIVEGCTPKKYYQLSDK